MFASIGAPELVVILVIGSFYAVPIAAAVWVIVTLHRIRAGQQAMDTRLEAIERSLQRR
jgi:hypothetical protein